MGIPGRLLRALLRAIDSISIPMPNRSFMPHVFNHAALPRHTAWLPVHHTDSQPRFQQIALAEVSRRHAADEFSATDLACLCDRVAVKSRDSQTSRTLHQCAKGVVQAQQIADLGAVDARRSALGVTPLPTTGA